MRPQSARCYKKTSKRFFLLFLFQLVDNIFIVGDFLSLNAFSSSYLLLLRANAKIRFHTSFFHIAHFCWCCSLSFSFFSFSLFCLCHFSCSAQSKVSCSFRGTEFNVKVYCKVFCSARIKRIAES